jgi:hypothetical protein
MRRRHVASLVEMVVAEVRLLDLQQQTQSVRVLPTITSNPRMWLRVKRRVIARIVGQRGSELILFPTSTINIGSRQDRAALCALVMHR